MEIRELGVENVEEIKKVILEIFSKPPWNDTWPDGQLHLYILELIGNRNSLSFGLYGDENLIGVSLGKVRHWYEGTEYWIDEFGILPTKQKNGLGSKFLNGIEDFLTTIGIVGIVLLTDRTMPAYRFYQRNGFQAKEEQVFFVKEIR